MINKELGASWWLGLVMNLSTGRQAMANSVFKDCWALSVYIGQQSPHKCYFLGVLTSPLINPLNTLVHAGSASAKMLLHVGK